MSRNTMLAATSALTALLFSIHWIQDIVLGVDRIGGQSIGGVAILFVWMVAVLLLPRHRAGQVLMLLAGFFSVGVTVLHLNGSRIQEITRGPGGFAFGWVLVVMGAGGALSFLLAILELFRKRNPSGSLTGTPAS